MKKTNEMPKNQTGSHAFVPKRMGKGPKYPFAFYVALVLSMTVGAMPVLAAGDPLAVINNLSTFIFSHPFRYKGMASCLILWHFICFLQWHSSNQKDCSPPRISSAESSS